VSRPESLANHGGEAASAGRPLIPAIAML